MKKKTLGAILLGFMTLFVVGCQQTKVDENMPASFSSLPANEFISLYKKVGGVMIDIRTPQEISQGKLIDEAMELDYYNTGFNDELRKLDRNNIYFIYCAHGNRTRYTKDTMKLYGFTKVYDLKGGVASVNKKEIETN